MRLPAERTQHLARATLTIVAGTTLLLALLGCADYIETHGSDPAVVIMIIWFVAGLVLSWYYLGRSLRWLWLHRRHG